MGMCVYVVTSGWQFEGFSIIDVFENEQEAIALALRQVDPGGDLLLQPTPFVGVVTSRAPLRKTVWEVRAPRCLDFEDDPQIRLFPEQEPTGQFVAVTEWPVVPEVK